MIIKSSWLISALTAFTLVPMTAAATSPVPVETSGSYNGHYYEVIPYPTSGHPDKSWAAAKIAAESSEYEYLPGMFISGHLATITSSGEDSFIEGRRQATGLSASQGEAWVGGSTDSLCTPVPGCGWSWVNGEGVISTMQVPLAVSSYSNWLGGEPNNVGAGEKHLGIGLNGQFGWNDEGNLGNIGGYVIEYDVPIPASSCSSGGTGCAVSEAVNLVFPPAVVLEPDAQIDVRRYEFTDDLAACGAAARELFISTDPNEPGAQPDAILPAYLCGSPKFQVVVAETEGVVFPSGTIVVTNETDIVFPDNLYECEGPVEPNDYDAIQNPDSLLDPDDPQNRDVMAWQNSDLTKMPENDLGMAHGFRGSVGEYTFECGSSRGKGNSLSLYFVGLHIDFGPGYELSANAPGNHMKFVELTRYKLVVLKDVILGSQVALNSSFGQRIGYRTLRWAVNSAIFWHDRGAYNRALQRLRLIDWVLQYLPYTEIAGENYQGETEMRNSNGIFMYTDKVMQ